MFKSALFTIVTLVAGASQLCLAGLQKDVVVDGVVQRFDGARVEVLDHGKLMMIPRGYVKSDRIREGQRIQVELPFDQVRSSPNERLRQLKKDKKAAKR